MMVHAKRAHVSHDEVSSSTDMQGFSPTHNYHHLSQVATKQNLSESEAERQAARTSLPLSKSLASSGTVPYQCSQLRHCP